MNLILGLFVPSRERLRRETCDSPFFDRLLENLLQFDPYLSLYRGLLIVLGGLAVFATRNIDWIPWLLGAFWLVLAFALATLVLDAALGRRLRTKSKFRHVAVPGSLRSRWGGNLRHPGGYLNAASVLASVSWPVGIFLAIWRDNSGRFTHSDLSRELWLYGSFTLVWWMLALLLASVDAIRGRSIVAVKGARGWPHPLDVTVLDPEGNETYRGDFLDTLDPVDRGVKARSARIQVVAQEQSQPTRGGHIASYEQGAAILTIEYEDGSRGRAEMLLRDESVLRAWLETRQANGLIPAETANGSLSSR